MGTFVVPVSVLFQLQLHPHPLGNLFILISIYGAKLASCAFISKLAFLTGRSIGIAVIAPAFDRYFTNLAQKLSPRTNVTVCPFLIDKLRSIVFPSASFIPLLYFKAPVRDQRLLTFPLKPLIVVFGGKPRIRVHPLMLFPTTLTTSFYRFEKSRFIIILAIHLKVSNDIGPRIRRRGNGIGRILLPIGLLHDMRIKVSY